MSYTPTNWDNGDIITAAKLNKIEQGISEASSSSDGGGGLVVTEAIENFVSTLDKTWKEIHDAIAAGRCVFIHRADDDNPSYGVYNSFEVVGYCAHVMGADVEEDGYVVQASGAWISETETGYPTMNIQ